MTSVLKSTSLHKSFKDLDDVSCLEIIKNSNMLDELYVLDNQKNTSYMILVKTKKIKSIEYLVGKNYLIEPNMICYLINESLFDYDLYLLILKRMYVDENIYNLIFITFIKKYPDQKKFIIEILNRIYHPNNLIKDVVNARNNELITYFIDHYDVNLDKYGYKILEYCDKSLKSIIFFKMSIKNLDDHKRNILYYVIKYGDNEILDKLIQKYPKLINNIDKDKRSILHYVYEKNDIDALQILLKHNKDILKMKHNELGLLQTAIILDCSKELINILFENDHNIDIKQTHYKTWPIQEALKWCNDEDKLIWIIDKCKNLNVQDDVGRSALHYAIQYSNNRIIKYLLSKKINVNLKTFDNMYPIHAAFKYNVSIIPEILKNEPILNTNYEDLLIEHYCVLHNIDIININKDNPRRFLFHFVIEHPTHKSLNYCIDNKVDLLKRDKVSILEYAVYKKINDHYVYKIIDLFDENDLFESSIIFNVMRNSNEHTLLYLCSKLTNIDIKDCCKKNLLQISLENKYYELANYLIDRNINIQTADIFRDNALLTSLMNCKNDNLIKEIIYKTNDINYINEDKMNALHLGFIYKHTESIIRLLIDRECNQEQLNKYNQKPIYYLKKDDYSEEFVNNLLNSFIKT